jgi:hypothetical protein
VKPLPGGCKWRIPAAAAGKRALLRVTLGYDEEQISKTFRLKIKQP